MRVTLKYVVIFTELFFRKLDAYREIFYGNPFYINIIMK